MKKVSIIFVLIFSLACHAQDIKYDDIISLNWKDHPFSIVEMLTEKGYKFMGKLAIDDPLEPSQQTRETLYNMIYGYMKDQNPISVANVSVDEMCINNISSTWPVVKLRFTHENKNIFNKLSDEIKSACGQPDMGFYIAPYSLTFVIDKELLSGEPNYIILVYYIPKEMLEEFKKVAKEILKQPIAE
jgi:hypothetical protein